jgi:hypothetical protein
MTVASPVPAAPVASPDHRLAPAAIGRSYEPAQIVWVECANWCTEDHVAGRQVAVEDIVHSSETSATAVGSFLSPGNVFELYATVKADASTHDPRLHRAHIVLDDGGGEDAFLTEEMAEEVADRLVKFAAEIRALARTARMANAA